ncbi:helix-turn-helix transcriptional regulator [Kribbella alba]|uniref:helix-turn-helix transcriptional regulator n=1 Tax=Kribbella alba TaxID=190197 RepID=UPI0031E487CA
MTSCSNDISPCLPWVSSTHIRPPRSREYELCRLLVVRIGNKSIASRLQISPRTVEKHVASLMTKTQQPDGRRSAASPGLCCRTDPWWRACTGQQEDW